MFTIVVILNNQKEGATMHHAIIDTVNKSIVLTGTETELVDYMGYIIKTNGKNDLLKINRFELVSGRIADIKKAFDLV